MNPTKWNQILDMSDRDGHVSILVARAPTDPTDYKLWLREGDGATSQGWLWRDEERYPGCRYYTVETLNFIVSSMNLYAAIREMDQTLDEEGL